MFNRHLRTFVLKYGFLFLIGIAILIVVDYIQLDVSKNLGLIIDLLAGELEISGSKEAQLLVFIKELAKVVIVVAIGRILWRLFIFGAARKIEFGLRNKMFNHATKLSQDFYSHEKVGGMMTYFINDLNAIRMAVGPGLMMIVDSIFLGSFTLIRMFNLDRNLTLLSLIPLSFMLFSMYFINQSMRKQFQIRQEKFHDLSDFTQENFSGLSVIKAYVREIYERQTFDRKSEELYDMNIKFFKKSVWVQLLTSVATNIVIMLIIGYGALIVIRTTGTSNPFTAGSLSTYLSYFFTLSWPIMALTRFITLNSQSQASINRITEFLDTKITVKDSNDVLDVKEITPSIYAKNLYFSYPDNNITVLSNINFTINEGEMVGILGKTGSGKSTLVDLLLRTYNLNPGELFIGNYDIMRLPVKQVRDLIGYVPQDNFLFSDTIANNIGFAYETLDQEKVIAAAKLADIYDNVNEFKEKFETVLGERGVTVSGGQKQRISIARAIAKNPDILILDDAVSAVDTKTEEAIIRNLYELRAGKTTIFIAHRISTVKNMDKIILLDDGKIVDIGTHSELLARSTFYQEIVEKQTLEAMVDGGEFDA